MTFLNKIIRSYTNGRFANKSANLIRKEFIDYFTDLKHNVIRSSPVSPINDRSLAFVNAGMNQVRFNNDICCTMLMKIIVSHMFCS